MNGVPVWSIGGPDGRSSDLHDNYLAPDAPGDVVWRAGARERQRWPLYHPSEADPAAGYRARPYRIEFQLDTPPRASFTLRLKYLVIAPRVPYLKLSVNGTDGTAYLRPRPSTSGEIRLHAGLHTTIYSEGVVEVSVAAGLLRKGENLLEITCLDGGEVIRVSNPEAIARLDRMANGAGLIYQHLTLTPADESPLQGVQRAEVEPSVVYLRDAAGELRERCDLYLELAGPVEAGSLTLSVQDGERKERHAVAVPSTALGHLHHAFELFDGAGEVHYRLAGTLGAVRVCSEGVITRRRKWKVFVAAHAHTDVGYTHRQTEVAERLCRNVDVAIERLEGGRDAFAYHLDATWALERFLETRTEPARARLVEAIRAGGIGVVGNRFDLLSQFAALEDLIRNHGWSEEFLRPHGLTVELDAIVDVPSLSSSLPAVLAGCGIRYLVHANNQDRGPFRVIGGLHRLSPFWWEGAAGGRVLCWLAKMYCELRKVCGSPPTSSAAERGLSMWLREYEHEAYAPDAVLLYGQEADNTDLDPQPIDFVRSWNATYAYPRLLPADPVEYFRYVEGAFGDSLATVRGDGGAYWEDGVGSSIVPTMAARAAQATLPAAERMAALATVHAADRAFPRDRFDAVWSELLSYDEHTWGAFLSGSDPEALLTKDQWRVKEAGANAAQLGAEQLLHAAATRHALSWRSDGREVVVHNPHSWPSSATATVEIGAGESVVEVGGRAVPSRELRRSATQKVIELWVDDLPALSYRRYRLQPEGDRVGARVQDGPAATSEPGEGTPTQQPVVVENGFYRLELDPTRGCVTSLIDLGLQRELVEVTAPWGFGQLLYASGGEGTRLMSNQADLPPGDPVVTADFEPARVTRWRFPYGEHVAIAGSTPWGESEAVWTLFDDAKRVEVAFTVRKTERRAKEAMYVAFPLDLPGARVLSDSQLGWVDWATGTLPGACKEWLPLQTGVRVEGADVHALLASPDVPLFCVGDVVRGLWPKDHPLGGGRLYGYLLNNYWHTNYKASQGGEIRFRYLFTSDEKIGASAAYRLGWAERRPLYAHRMSYQAFRDPAPVYAAAEGGTLMDLAPDHVVLATLQGSRTGAGLSARLQEIDGRAGEAELSFPGRRVVRAWETDLLERELRALPVSSDGTVHAQVAAWGLTTLRLELEGGATR